MTESDVLVRAARALREAHGGQREGSGFTRARIMNTVHHERRRRTLRWAIFSPIASVLLVGSAWAQSSGKWPVIWRAVTSVFVAEPAPAPAPTSQLPVRRDPPRAALPPPAPASVDAGSDTADDPAPAPSDEPEVEAVRAEPPARAESTRRRRPRSSEPTRRSRQPKEEAPDLGAPEPGAPEPERERELGRFRAAHDLHFKGRARDAIEAYARYLREFPDGRFVPEARYAMALDQIKLGNPAAAREALEPFAEGRYGNYRRREALELLEALARQEAGGR